MIVPSNRISVRTEQYQNYVSISDQTIRELKTALLQKLMTVIGMDDLIIESQDKSLFLQTRSRRGSHYRGVSRNGIKWQAMIVRGPYKKYVGAIRSEEAAARMYDKYALIMQGFDVSSGISNEV